MINSSSASSAPVGYRFPREVIAVAVRWYLRCGLSYRDVEELLRQRGTEVDHVAVYRWVQIITSSPLGMRSCRTCAAVTTRSPPTCPRTTASGSRSPNSRCASNGNQEP